MSTDTQRINGWLVVGDGGIIAHLFVFHKRILEVGKEGWKVVMWIGEGAQTK